MSSYHFVLNLNNGKNNILEIYWKKNWNLYLILLPQTSGNLFSTSPSDASVQAVNLKTGLSRETDVCEVEASNG